MKSSIFVAIFLMLSPAMAWSQNPPMPEGYSCWSAGTLETPAQVFNCGGSATANGELWFSGTIRADFGSWSNFDCRCVYYVIENGGVVESAKPMIFISGANWYFLPDIGGDPTSGQGNGQGAYGSDLSKVWKPNVGPAANKTHYLAIMNPGNCFSSCPAFDKNTAGIPIVPSFAGPIGGVRTEGSLWVSP